MNDSRQIDVLDSSRYGDRDTILEEDEEELKDHMEPLDTNGTEEECELDKVIVPNTGSSGGSFSGPHHRKFVCSSSGGANKFIKGS